MYICKTHLSDPGFARPAPSAASTPSTPTPTASPPPGSPAGVSQAEIDKVKAEYEEKQKRKKEKEAEKDKDKDKEKEKEKGWLSTVGSFATTAAKTAGSASVSTMNQLFPPPSPPPTPAPAVTSKVFILHRDIFTMRMDQAKKKWQAKDAAERASKMSLPSVPKGPLARAAP